MMSGARPFILLGAPLDLGAQNLGVDVGPDAFRYQQIVDKLADSGFQIDDHGDILPRSREDIQVGSARLRFADEIIRVCQVLAAKTDQALREERGVIVLGGDHSINLGAVSGAAAATKGNLGLIYLDAHGDMNTPETTLTGNLHGMHLAALLGFGPDQLIKLYGPEIKIKKQNLLHIGGSDLDQAEKDLIAREQLPIFTLLDLLSQGMAPLFKMIDDLATQVDNIWVSLDLDVIDAMYAPGAGMPNRGGLTYREIAAIAGYVGQECHVVGIDVVEYNPLQDVDHKTAELGIELIAKFLGSNYSWYTNYLERNKL